MSCRGFIVTAVLLASATAAAQATDPNTPDIPDSGWVPLVFERDDMIFNDGVEGQPERDVVGTATTDGAAAYINADAYFLYLRLRVDGDPFTTSWKEHGWACQLSNDDNDATWEREILLFGKAPEAVHVYVNEGDEDDRDSPSEAADAELEQPTYPASTHAREDPNAPGDDNYVDFAVPLTRLGLPAGEELTTPVRFVCGTSSNAGPDLTTGGSGDVVGVGENVATTWTNVMSKEVTFGCGTFLCTGDLDCDTESGLCVPPGECVTNDECDPNSPEPVCSDTFECVACTPADAGGCPMVGDGSEPACATEGPVGECVECTPAEDDACVSPDDSCVPWDEENPRSFTCQDCLTDTDCNTDPNTPICVDNDCEGCDEQDDCTGNAAGDFCQLGTGRCVECLDSGDCTDPNNPICNTAGDCVPCDDVGSPDAACAEKDDPATSDPNTPVCNEATGRCEECVDDPECVNSPVGPICDATSFTCRDCIDADCAPDVCDETSGECVECVESTDCDADPNEPICSMENLCGPCASHMDCDDDGMGPYPSTPACVAEGDREGQCVQCTGDNEEACGDTQVCNTSTFLCVQCTANSDCVALGDPNEPECDLDPEAPGTVLNVCIACTGNEGCDGNPLGEVCRTNGRCGECNIDEDCTADPNEPNCDTAAGVCVECVDNDDCTGEVCDDNQCVPGCDDNDDCVERDPNEPVCNTGGDLDGQCTECSVSDPNDIGLCGGDEPYCVEIESGGDVVDEVCVQCRESGDCPEEASICLGNTCVECQTNDDCLDPNEPFCDLELPLPQHECVADCPGDYACPEETPICQDNGPLIGECTECAEGRDDFCDPNTPHCLVEEGTCEECTLDIHCPGGFCNAETHTCAALPPDAGVPDAMVVVPDAAVPDAPVDQPDAAQPADAMVVIDAPPAPDAPAAPDARVDAAPAPDAAAVADARPADARPSDARPADARADAQVEQPLVGGVLEGGGCDCRAGSSGGPTPSGTIWLVLGALGVILRLRRRR
jgi:MYXO-CTERM domain-containing protein